MKTELKNRLIPWYFVLFFVVLIVVNIVFITLANKSYTGLYTEGAYEKGLAYNKVIEQFEKQEQSGITFEIREQYLKNNEVEFNIQLLQNLDGNNLTLPDTLNVEFVRPVHEGYDFKKQLQKDSSGKYNLKVKFPLKGKWNAKFKANINGQDAQTIRGVFVE